MTIAPSLLLLVVILWPLFLAFLCLLPKLGPRMLLALPLGPLPALAAVFLAPRDQTLSVPGVLLDGGLRLTETGVLFLGGAALLWFWAGVYALRYMRGDSRAQTFALFWMLVLAGNLGVFLAADLATFYVSFALVSLAAWWLGHAWQELPALLAAGVVADLWGFLLPNLLIATIVTGLLLRYFWVTAQWRREVEEEARSRIRALQARIRPHFLFNSMNTIAALTRSDPARAEEAVEDLADLFRASLSEATSSMTLKEELELSRIYQRIESHRLGARLAVEWRIAGLPLRARVPALSLQPLLENAIYHGIEQLPAGGTVVVEGRYEEAGGMIELCIDNPLPPARTDGPALRAGNRIALDNLRQRFALAWGPRASVEAGPAGERYRVRLRFPAELAG